MSKLYNIFRSYFFFVVLAISVSAIIYAKITPKPDDFKQAEDFPRDALIYIQIRDLPLLINLWNESNLKENYLESDNFGEFENNHLALKLAERAQEISSSVRFFTDLDILATISENKAALAVYDVGKIEFVFIAPMSEKKILASSFYTNSSIFEEIKLDDGTVVHTLETEVDRKRQTQKILFTNFRGRFILATTEKYFLQTLENIKGKTPKNRLSETPNFKQLAHKTTPNLATVWLDQTKLNDDWYFKHYWLMSGGEELKNLRAGMFDFEIQTDKLVEKRVFLTNSEKSARNIEPDIANHLNKLIPENVPFYQIQTAETANTAELISETLFDNRSSDEAEKTENPRKNYYFDDWGKSYSYNSLDSDFDEQIDQADDKISNLLPKNQNILNENLAKVISEAQPIASAKMFSPQSLSAPLFFDNRRALIISLQNRANLSSEMLEKSLVETAINYLTVGNLNADFEWKDLQTTELKARQLKMPSLGWSVFYAFKNNELIFSNSEELLKEIVAANNNRAKFDGSFSEFSTINLIERQAAFDDIFGQIANAEDTKTSDDFFAGNIASLLDVISDVEKIEIKRNSEQNYLFEEIDFILKKSVESAE
jgi:hypothetical protein